MKRLLFPFGDFFTRVRREFDVDVVVVSHIVGSPAMVHHQVLSSHASEVETLLASADLDTCTMQVITHRRPLEITALSRFQPKLNCPLMAAENLEAFLGVPFPATDGGYAALQIMQANSRIWSATERQKLSDFALLILNEDVSGVKSPLTIAARKVPH